MSRVVKGTKLSVLFQVMEDRGGVDVRFTKIEGRFTSNAQAERAIIEYLEALGPDEAWSPTLWVKKVFYRPLDYMKQAKKRVKL